MRQEKLDLRLRYGVHHKRHAHRSQSDAAERHGVTTHTVSTGVGGDRTAMTSPFLVFAAKAGPTTTQTRLETINWVCFIIPSFNFCMIISPFICISMNIFCNCFKEPRRCWRSERKKEKRVCFGLEKLTIECVWAPGYSDQVSKR